MRRRKFNGKCPVLANDPNKLMFCFASFLILNCSTIQVPFVHPVVLNKCHLINKRKTYNVTKANIQGRSQFIYIIFAYVVTWRGYTGLFFCQHHIYIVFYFKLHFQTNFIIIFHK